MSDGPDPVDEATLVFSALNLLERVRSRCDDVFRAAMGDDDQDTLGWAGDVLIAIEQRDAARVKRLLDTLIRGEAAPPPSRDGPPPEVFTAATRVELLRRLGWSVKYHRKLVELEEKGAIRVEEVKTGDLTTGHRMTILLPGIAINPRRSKFA